jgi:hypothetical protein
MSTLRKIAASAAALMIGMASVVGPVLARGGGPAGGAFVGGGGFSHPGGFGGGFSHGGSFAHGPVGGFSHPGAFGAGVSHGDSFIHGPAGGLSHPNVFGSHPAINEQLHGQMRPGLGGFPHHEGEWREGEHRHGGWRVGHGYRYWWYGGPVWWGAADECPYAVNACMQCAPIYDEFGNVIGTQLENVC